MKTYEIKKKVKAKSLREALNLEKKVKVEYIIMVDDDEEDEDDNEEFENGKIYGFRRK